MLRSERVLVELSQRPENFLIIHYSSQSLFDEVEQGFSPRITSIVVMFAATRQTLSFSLHAIAEELGISREDVSSCYDQIEAEILDRFFDMAKANFGKYWLHWNMKNIVYGFEHIEHRYRVLKKAAPPQIPLEHRINLTDVLKAKYGPNFAPDPRMTGLMDLNGKRDPRFLSGSEESQAFARQEFIRMNGSTISKVEFFRHVTELASKGKLRTGGSGFAVRVESLLESTTAKVIALVSGVIGIPSGAIGLWLFFH